MRLTKTNLKNISSQPGLSLPDEKIFFLPEKVLQFGTGVLLRGLPDYFIDKANRQGIFNGRIVMVKSTGGSTIEFDEQNNLYTLCIKGIEEDKTVEEYIINSSISRVIAAQDNWQMVLDCARNPDMQIVISNTTEVGIVLVQDDVCSSPPQSFPGKLLAFLYERYKTFGGSEESGMIIIPAELITDNGKKLFSILVGLAQLNKLEEAFIHWLKTANHFCNSLVDRIVPGKLPAEDKKSTEARLGYTDELMIMAEPFRLWAIETDNEVVKQRLSFSLADDGVVLAPDIEKFRELKLRLLNGTHTFSCGLAFLAGFRTVKEAMADTVMSSFIENLMLREIAETIAGQLIPETEARNYARRVIERFRNPFLEHLWINICMQYTSKMKMRNIPLLLKYYHKYKEAPEYMTLGFAAYLLFMKCKAGANGQFSGLWNQKEYFIHDEAAAWFAEKWQSADSGAVVNSILSDKNFWGAELSGLNGFAERVKTDMNTLLKNGVISAVRSFEMQKTEV
jgi:tagaturonate reductase